MLSLLPVGALVVVGALCRLASSIWIEVGRVTHNRDRCRDPVDYANDHETRYENRWRAVLCRRRWPVAWAVVPIDTQPASRQSGSTTKEAVGDMSPLFQLGLESSIPCKSACLAGPFPCRIVRFMEAELNAILERARGEIADVQTRPEFEQFKASISGPKGAMTQVMKGMGKVPKEDKPKVGRAINAAKQELEALFTSALEKIDALEMEKAIGPAIDPTLPSPDFELGSRHPINQIRARLVKILQNVGFSVAEGPEVETEWFCFDALNTAPDHPARDLQDTLYLKKDANLSNVSRHSDERYLLRTHTSTVQIRTMLKYDPPIRVFSPGRVFRRDTVDATHSSCFHQIEALYVDKNVTVADLKALLDYMMRELLGSDAETRFRPHFFPYTEPSFELDCSSAHLKKVGKRWTEMGGCGMVDPSVFEAVGYDPEVYSGYAFGFGLERLAMILYGIDDIRHFYQNDIRFLCQFA